MGAVRSAVVVGGGIAGSVTALALDKAGIQVQIAEAYDGPNANVGGAFNIASNGLDALDAVDALPAVRGMGFPAPELAMHNHTGKLLGTLSTGLPLADGTNTTSFRRADMFAALRAETARRGINTEKGKRLVRYEDSGQSVTAYFEDGSSATADVLIGADGIHSTVRGMLDPAAAQPRYTGLVSFGGFAPNPGLTPDPGKWHMTFGRKAFLGMFVPTPEEAWWFINVPRDEPLSRADIIAEGIDKWSDRLVELFRTDRVPVAELLRAQGTDGIIVLGGQYDLPKVDTWHRGRVAIVGDAAHAASTSSGQGASMAMESAVTLGRCLRDGRTPEDAFSTYERLRRDRVAKIIAYGAKSASSKAAGPFAAMMRDTFMSIGLKHFYKPEADAWLLGHHIEFGAPVAAELAAV